MQKNRISLIGTTQGGRDFEVERLFKGLIGTTDFLEIVFVDQSGLMATEKLVEKYQAKVTIKLLKSEKVSLSKARNLALQQSTGNVIGFCDDDAFYDRNFLELIANKTYTQPFIVSFPITDFETMTAYGGRNYPKFKKNMGYLSVIKYSSSVGTFLFLGGNSLSHFFDERLGVGAKFGGSEETEFFFRMLSIGYKGVFLPIQGIYHDNDSISSGEVAFLSRKYKLYAQGYAVVIKKYMFKSKGVLFIEVLDTILRSCAGLVLRGGTRYIYLNRLKGFLKGLFYFKL